MEHLKSIINLKIIFKDFNMLLFILLSIIII